MNYYRRKPAVIEAVQYDGTDESAKSIRRLHENDGKFDNIYLWRQCLYLNNKKVKLGDWVVKEDGKVFVCKSDEFEIKFGRVESLPPVNVEVVQTENTETWLKENSRKKNTVAIFLAQKFMCIVRDNGEWEKLPPIDHDYQK